MGGLRLHKFLSNSKSVLESIPPSECAIEVKALELALNELERALGIHWHIESDTLRFLIFLKDQPATRRGILSTIASVFDPLGLIAPFLLIGKKVLPEMCRHGISWDELSACHSTVQERDEAQCIIIKDLQRQVYPEEIKSLSKGTQLPSQSLLRQMDVFLGQEEILKVGGKPKLSPYVTETSSDNSKGSSCYQDDNS